MAETMIKSPPPASAKEIAQRFVRATCARDACGSVPARTLVSFGEGPDGALYAIRGDGPIVRIDST